MQIASDQPDIMLFPEVIPKAQKIIYLKIKGYEIYKNFEYTDTNLGASSIRGIAIYVKSDIKCKAIKLQRIFGDHVWVKIRLRNGDNLLCAFIYRRSLPKEKTATIERTVCEVIVEAVQTRICRRDIRHNSILIYNPSLLPSSTCISTNAI